MYPILLVFHVLVSLMLVGLILLQQGKGAQTGASFGSGASQTIFGSQGSGGFLSRATGTLAALFFVLNLSLVYWINKTNYSAQQLRVPEGTITQEKEPKPSSESEINKEHSSTGTPVTDVPNID